MITISPGHWRVGSGAKDLIDEVTEARKVVNRVVEILRQNKITTHHVEDNTSKNQQQNLSYLVSQHNKTNRKLDVSIHFNSFKRTNKGMGVEVLYYDAKDLAAKVSNAISKASGLIDRGAKQRKDLYFLNATHKPAILIEVCFVNSEVDVAIYNRDFEKICQAIARELAAYIGHSIPPTAPPPRKVMEEKGETKVEPLLNSTGRAMARKIIEKAVADGMFKKSHLEKLDKYSDADLISYALTYVYNKL